MNNGYLSLVIRVLLRCYSRDSVKDSKSVEEVTIKEDGSARNPDSYVSNFARWSVIRHRIRCRCGIPIFSKNRDAKCIPSARTAGDMHEARILKTIHRLVREEGRGKEKSEEPRASAPAEQRGRTIKFA